MNVSTEIVAEHVVRITVPDPGALDRREVAAGEALRDALLAAADDDATKAIVLAGLAATSDVPAPGDAEPGEHHCYTGVRGLHQVVTYCKKVVIAEVDGTCGPTASALCLGADFVLASPDSRFASPFGVPEANFPLAVLTMRANRTKAWMLRGGFLACDDACTAGFVNEVVDGAGLREATTTLGRRVALMPLDGLTVSKMNIGAAFDVVGVGRDFDAVEAATTGLGTRW
ncbi:MAG TPA: enoyl-CoA hydratase-related protein [Amycolatopsis sp.]|nr:enoyl-CoA hydratase-related protein [Amycolatopsis sp.]